MFGGGGSPEEREGHMEEKISVVIPTYNRADSILDCIRSVQDQTYQNLEIIVVDDGSQDGTEKLFEDFPDKRVIYHRYTPNQGANHARNVGIQMATGNVIAFQDSDDLWMPDKLEKQYKYLVTKKKDLVFCGLERIEDGETTYHPLRVFDEVRDPVPQLLYGNLISTQTILVKKSVALDVMFDESLKRFQDWDFVIHTAVKGYQIGYVRQALVRSEVKSDSISARVNPTAGEKIYEKYKKQYDQYPSVKAHQLRMMAHACHLEDRDKASRFLKESLKTKFTFSVFLRYLANEAGLWK